MTRTDKFWDRIASNYDNPVEPDTETFRAVENAKKHLKQSDIVLDYGCATGAITLNIAESVHEVHAIDISAKMIEQARSNSSERNVENIHFAHATITDERYTEVSFDAILAFNILHLLEDPQLAIQRINDLLKPGGVFISSTACMGEYKTFLGTFLSLLSKVGIVPYLNMLNVSELEALIVNGNFQIVEAETITSDPTNYFIAARKQ